MSPTLPYLKLIFTSIAFAIIATQPTYVRKILIELCEMLIESLLLHLRESKEIFLYGVQQCKLAIILHKRQQFFFFS